MIFPWAIRVIPKRKNQFGISRFVAFLALSFILCTPLIAQDRELKSETSDKLDAILLLDGSGSMRVTDPTKLREEGAKLFVQSLRPGDRIGNIEFTEEAKVVRSLL